VASKWGWGSDQDVFSKSVEDSCLVTTTNFEQNTKRHPFSNAPRDYLQIKISLDLALQKISELASKSSSYSIEKAFQVVLSFSLVYIQYGARKHL